MEVVGQCAGFALAVFRAQAIHPLSVFVNMDGVGEVVRTNYPTILGIG